MRRILLALTLLASFNLFADESAKQVQARQVARNVAPRLLTVSGEQLAKGGPASAMEVGQGKALPVQQPCLAGHGLAEQRTTEITTQLNKPYPQEQGVDYSLSQIRGTLSLRQPM